MVRVEDAIKYMEEKQSQTRSFRETAICLLILSILDSTKRAENGYKASDKSAEMNKWGYSTDFNEWTGGICDTREEALKMGKKAATQEDKNKFRIGRAIRASVWWTDADDAIETAQVRADSEYGDASEGYLDDVTDEDKKELNDKLSELFSSWQKKHGYEPNFYEIEDIEIIEV